MVPLARGSAASAASACAVSAAGSTPALLIMVPAVPSCGRSRATSRCSGSVAVLPAVVAASWAASIASRLRVVNFSAPNWLMAVLPGSLAVVEPVVTTHRVQRGRS